MSRLEVFMNDHLRELEESKFEVNGQILQLKEMAAVNIIIELIHDNRLSKRDTVWKFIKSQRPYMLDRVGVETFKDYIDYDLKNSKRAIESYNLLSDNNKKLFWEEVDFYTEKVKEYFGGNK